MRQVYLQDRKLKRIRVLSCRGQSDQTIAGRWPDVSVIEFHPQSQYAIRKRYTALERHEEDDLMGCDSDRWLGLYPRYPVNYLEEKAISRYGCRAITALLG